MSTQTQYPKLCRHKGRKIGYVRIDGRQRYLKGSWKDPEKPSRELLASYEALKFELDLQAAGGSYSINRLLDKYCRHLNSKDNLSISRKRNLKWAQTMLRRQLKPYRELTPEEMQVRDFNNIRERWNALEYSITTIRTYWSEINKFFKWAVARGFSSPEVLLKMESLPQMTVHEYSSAKPSKVRHAVKWEQVQATLPHLSETLQTALLVALGTGARPQEILDMRWDDIDRSNKIWQYEVVSHKGSWRNGNRMIYISLPIQKLLKQYQMRRLNPDAEYIFTGAESWALNLAKKTGDCPKETFENRPPTVSDRLDSRRLYQAVKRICAREKIEPWTPYQTRHFFAEQMLAKLSDHFKGNGSEGLAIEAVSAMLGHKDIDITRVYAKRNLSLSRDLLNEVNINFVAAD